jgi:hypothetical protein
VSGGASACAFCQRLSLARVIILLSSRTHRTELATPALMSQSRALKLVVENALLKDRNVENGSVQE